ncbi:MAG: RNHCP domain-containing protein, partial [Patescibacteria group bacterium]
MSQGRGLTLCSQVKRKYNTCRGQNPVHMESNQKKKFLVPKEEPYECEHCGTSVMGGRYNNHCPSCLWSKHVDDKIPGDRASDC